MGACLGAKYGIDGIPKQWIEKTASSLKAVQFAIDVTKINQT